MSLFFDIVGLKETRNGVGKLKPMVTTHEDGWKRNQEEKEAEEERELQAKRGGIRREKEIDDSYDGGKEIEERLKKILDEKLKFYDFPLMAQEFQELKKAYEKNIGLDRDTVKLIKKIQIEENQKNYQGLKSKLLSCLGVTGYEEILDIEDPKKLEELSKTKDILSLAVSLKEAKKVSNVRAQEILSTRLYEKVLNELIPLFIDLEERMEYPWNELSSITEVIETPKSKEDRENSIMERNNKTTHGPNIN